MFKSAFQVTFAVDLVDDNEDEEFETLEVEHIHVTIPCKNVLTIFEFTELLSDKLSSVMEQADIDDDAMVVAIEEITDMNFVTFDEPDSDLEDTDDDELPDTPDGTDSSEVTH